MADNNLPLRYNPHCEAGNLNQVAAASWELLRRCPPFIDVVEKWVTSEQFRIDHVTERTTFTDNLQARCALGWMLPPNRRFDLAQYESQRGFLFWDPMANFGPILVERHLERQEKKLRECIQTIFDVKPDPEAGGILALIQPWPATPAKFRSQFLSIFDEPDLREIRLDEHADSLLTIGNHLVSGPTVSSKELSLLGRYLFQLGEQYKRIGRDYKMAGIRRQVYPEHQLNDILRRVKQSLPYDPKTGRDSASKKSFLGTRDQWELFLAWEAHKGNAYRAAGDFLPNHLQKPKQRRLRGELSRSEIQRNHTSAIRRAAIAIAKWIYRMYPNRNVDPATVRIPKIE